jgi:hypothetical protein
MSIIDFLQFRVYTVKLIETSQPGTLHLAESPDTWKLKMEVSTFHVPIPFKGIVARDFRPLFFFHQSTPYRSLINRLKLFRIWLCIPRDNRFESRQNRFQRGQ